MKRTIREAIVEALRKKPLTAKEVYQAIIDQNLYTFKAKSPQSLVTGELRRHSEGINLKTSSSQKYFRSFKDGTYSLIEP